MMTPLSLRYGDTDVPSVELNTPAIELMLKHRSVRGYKPDPLPNGALETIIAAAQSAATSSNLQTWSVVHVTDPTAKAACAAMAGGQKHIEEAPCFLLFLADLARLNRVADRAGIPHAGNDTFEMFVVAAIDAALAAQNGVIAAESLGLSTVYIGGMRNKPEDIAELIGLPPGAAVVFGLCIGYAAESKGGAVKPRLPQEAVLHHGRYELEKQDAAIERYNAAMATFNAREHVSSTTPWTVQSSRRVSGPESLSGRHVLMQALRQMGFFRAE